MKNIVRAILVIVSVCLCVSCGPEQLLDSSLLVGTWREGSYYECYYSDGTGKYWDTSEDYYEDEAITFTWDFLLGTLTQYHTLEFGGVVPKVYTIEELTSSTLVYSDSFGVTHHFEKY